jgi:hypothetical protein
MRTLKTVIVIFLTIVLLSGCKESFSPKGEYKDQMIVYAVVSNQSNALFVRVYSSYNPPTDNPLSQTTDNQITGATITLTDTSSTITLRDTTIQRSDGNRYQSAIRAYVAYPFAAKRGIPYQLSVDAPAFGKITSSLGVASKGSVSMLTPDLLEEPTNDGSLQIQVYLGRYGEGYAVKFLIEYDEYIAGVWQPQQTEVPTEMNPSTGSPVINYRGQHQYRSNEGIEILTWPASQYLETVQQIYYNAVDTTHVRFKKARFILTQLDANLFTYYNVVNGFPDAFTLRLDEPDYSNIGGGRGLFGSMTSDTSTIDLPSEIKVPKGN